MSDRRQGARLGRLAEVLRGGPPSWHADAACRGYGRAMFPPEGITQAERDRLDATARRLCAGCPVLEDCREYVVAVRPKHGTWAGLTEKDRRRRIRRVPMS